MANLIDRENVIKAYEDFVNGYECFCTSDDYEYEMHKAVLALLKEQQETVEPIPYHRSDGTIFKYECRKCRTKIFNMDLFCRRCGHPIDWGGK